MFERFTSDARDVVKLAMSEAQRLGHEVVGSEHLLLALTTSSVTGFLAERSISHAGIEETLAHAEQDALGSVGIDLDEVTRAVEGTFGEGALIPTPTNGSPSFNRDAKRALKVSLEEAIRLKHRRIGAEHVLLGVLADEPGVARSIVLAIGQDPDDLRSALATALE